MTNQCKCEHCGLLVNELLAFVNTKKDVMDEVSLLQLCETHFSESAVDTAKTVLLTTLNRRITRKGDGKKKRNLQDIVTILKEEPDLLPTFVAKDLHKLPPVSFDHIDAASLLKDILVLKQELFLVKNNYASLSSIEAVNEEIASVKQSIDNLKTLHTTGGQRIYAGTESRRILQYPEDIDCMKSCQSFLSSTIKPEGGSRKVGVTAAGCGSASARLTPARSPPTPAPLAPPPRPSKRQRRKQQHMIKKAATKLAAQQNNSTGSAPKQTEKPLGEKDCSFITVKNKKTIRRENIKNNINNKIM
ncbi:hypothetical protein O0L34_g17334 [Tuta absoluta]|nr:hypothetical protein O0L34_g17334 [Tuta absoluta]